MQPRQVQNRPDAEADVQAITHKSRYQMLVFVKTDPLISYGINVTDSNLGNKFISIKYCGWPFYIRSFYIAFGLMNF